jgi:hypothetical protein
MDEQASRFVKAYIRDVMFFFKVGDGKEVSRIRRHSTNCEISGSYGGEYEDDSLLGYSAI